ncbi:heat-inducible transcriptional repressor HrcA [Mycoplasma sp. P36-A1]|uniref:heat-inducible transcriptional repressor HrcA n=1 Tax=Mycoplasma sp. P36-A1 TaxID=3252900 RepID=UPI003C301823
MLTSRQIDILKVIISDFIDQATPVGSQKLKITHELPYSTATIRNEMATLEDMGLLKKTHTSSGRVPSNLGYRYYVDYLLDEHDIDETTKAKLEAVFNNRKLEIEEVVKQSTKLIADMTSYTSIALGSDVHEELLEKIQVVPISNESIVIVIVTKSGRVQSKIFNIDSELDVEDLQRCVELMNKLLAGQKMSEVITRVNADIKDLLGKHMISYEYLMDALKSALMKFSQEYIFVSGKNNIINQPDFDDINKIKSLINIMEDDFFFDYLVSSRAQPSVMIGKENDVFEVDDVTVVTTNYQLTETEKGVIAIIGPTRMDYDKVINLLDYVSNKITQLLNEKKRWQVMNKENMEKENTCENDASEEVILNEENTNEENADASTETLTEEAKLQIEMAGLITKVQELENNVARAYADAQNYERRAKIDADNQVVKKVTGIVEKILPALDNFERALKVDSEDETLNNFLKGFDMIYQQLYSALEEEGIKQIDAIDKPFDSEYHQAVMSVAVDGVESGLVIEELQKGYTFKNKVLRHTLVKVSE